MGQVQLCLKGFEDEDEKVESSWFTSPPRGALAYPNSLSPSTVLRSLLGPDFFWSSGPRNLAE